MCSLKSQSHCVPEMTGQAWQVANMPDLGEIALSGKEQMVDHAFFKAADGRWRLWTQIRDTRKGRVFFEWLGDEDFESDRKVWCPASVCFLADKECGESFGTLPCNDIIQAPHVFIDDGRYYLVYGGGPIDAEDTTRQISMAVSLDGCSFDRILNADGQSRIAVGPGHSADNCLLKHDDVYYLYTGCSYFPNNYSQAGVVVRSSPSLNAGGQWSDFRVVQSGGVCGSHTHSSQSVSVIYRDGLFYLFKMGWSSDFETAVYYSDNPLDFGRGDEKLLTVLPVSACEIIQVDQTFYISSLMPDWEGVVVDKLRWQMQC